MYRVCVFRVENAQCSLLHDMVLRDVDVNCVDVHCVDCGGVKLQSPASDEIVQHINMLHALPIQSEHEAILQYPPLQLQSLPSYGQIPGKAGAIKELYEVLDPFLLPSASPPHIQPQLLTLCRNGFLCTHLRGACGWRELSSSTPCHR
jgi:hypothetical protein